MATAPAAESVASGVKQRGQEKKRKEAAKLDSLVKGLGATGDAMHAHTDVTRAFMLPLDDGKDGKGYTSHAAREDIDKRMKRQKFPSIADAVANGALPPAAVALASRPEVHSSGYVKESTRSADDGFRSGFDVTYTARSGIPTDKRKPSNTPAPSSPNPYDTGEQLDNTRYEKTHQAAYSFTGATGTTVHAPTQANQAVDTTHERHASVSGGAMVRLDTYYRSSVFSMRPTDDGEVEVMGTSYARRKNISAAAASKSKSGSGSGSDSDSG